MLSWVQDINWPVEKPIVERLTNCDLEIVEPIKSTSIARSNMEILCHLSNHHRLERRCS